MDERLQFVARRLTWLADGGTAVATIVRLAPLPSPSTAFPARGRGLRVLYRAA